MPHDVRMPDGTVIQNVPDGTTQAELQRRYQATKPKSQWQGFKEGLARAVNNYNYFLHPPAEMLVDQVLQQTGLAKKLAHPERLPTGQWRQLDQAINDQMAKSKYRSGSIGRIGADVLASAPMAAAGGGAPIALQGALQGAALAENPTDRLKLARDVLVSAVTAKGTDLVAKKVVAPVAKKIISSIKGDGLNRAQTVIANAIGDSNAIQAAKQNIADAQNLGLPYTLADSSPKLRALAGSATRFSPDALAAAEDPLATRAAGQIDRATSAINDLAPITDIAKRGAALKRLAGIKAAPLYRAAEMAGAPPYDQGLVDVLNTPAGQAAMQKGYEIAANMGKSVGELSPEALSTGELQAMPSYEAMQATKRGLDSMIEGYRNPITNALNTSDPKVEALNTVRARLLSKLGELNPNYASANKVYSDAISLKNALEKGAAVMQPQVTPQTVSNLVTNMPKVQLDQLQRGYATTMAEKAANASLSRNPYEAVAGSAAQQAKLQTLFPQGADQFLRTKALEGDMAKTAQEILGGSPTARRAAADAALHEDIVGGLIENGAQAVSGGGFNPMPFVKTALRNYSKFGMGKAAQARAADVARILLTQDNQGSLLTDVATQQARSEAIQRALRLLVPPASAAALAVTQPQ